jgi:hypothetical protein
MLSPGAHGGQIHRQGGFPHPAFFTPYQDNHTYSFV